MFDSVPAQVWILIILVGIGLGPASYAYHHITNSPSRRDITQPPPDHESRSPARFAVSIAMLFALLALAVFIFTPTAAAFASSAVFAPIIFGTIGLWALASAMRAQFTGQIEPFVKGARWSFKRATKPKRFWASVVWNALLGAGFIWIAIALFKSDRTQTFADQCHDPKVAESTEAGVAACSQLISKLEQDRTDNALLSATYVNRGINALEAGRLTDAETNFTQAHALQPDDPLPLANRGLTFAWSRNLVRAKQDFARVRAMDPSNHVVLRGEALVALLEARESAAIGHLTAALRADPNDMWSLELRARVYLHMGENQKSAADFQELQRKGGGKGDKGRLRIRPTASDSSALPE